MTDEVPFHEDMAMTGKNALRAIGLGNIIQIALLLFAIIKYGIQTEQRVSAVEKDVSEIRIQMTAQLELDHKRDVALGRLIERTHMPESSSMDGLGGK